ncbi:hypothetical protein OIU79_030814 [Salix purpurea]|uniref:Uncharacterized protein n=1 Tax=Salix purpurea TaxID=77065 RepID=A0A9Q0V9W9_SALPP|nr:hypothetical protein OIU79_030814 [Salix purpurea]
MLDFSRLLDF